MPNTPIEIAAQADAWDSDDVIAFRNFIENTKTGKKVLSRMLESTPALLSSGETNAIMIRNGEVRGVQIMANAFLQLATPLPEVPKDIENYPSLEDDTKWDGDKLNPNPK